MYWPVSSSKNGGSQPPRSKPPLGSSSGAPGLCMTPSMLMKVVTVSRMVPPHPGRLLAGPALILVTNGPPGNRHRPAASHNPAAARPTLAPTAQPLAARPTLAPTAQPLAARPTLAPTAQPGRGGPPWQPNPGAARQPRHELV